MSCISKGKALQKQLNGVTTGVSLALRWPAICSIQPATLPPTPLFVLPFSIYQGLITGDQGYIVQGEKGCMLHLLCQKSFQIFLLFVWHLSYADGGSIQGYIPSMKERPKYVCFKCTEAWCTFERGIRACHFCSVPFLTSHVSPLQRIIILLKAICYYKHAFTVCFISFLACLIDQKAFINWPLLFGFRPQDFQPPGLGGPVTHHLTFLIISWSLPHVKTNHSGQFVRLIVPRGCLSTVGTSTGTSPGPWVLSRLSWIEIDMAYLESCSLAVIPCNPGQAVGGLEGSLGANGEGCPTRCLWEGTMVHLWDWVVHGAFGRFLCGFVRYIQLLDVSNGWMGETEASEYLLFQSSSKYSVWTHLANWTSVFSHVLL